MRSVAAVATAAVLAAGVSYQRGRQPIPFFFPAYYVAANLAPGDHFSGFDAPSDRPVTVTKLLWNSWGAAGVGTARFEALDQGESVVCYIDVDCAGAAGSDARADCASPFVLEPNQHLNLQANAANTCEPSGMLQVVGSL